MGFGAPNPFMGHLGKGREYSTFHFHDRKVFFFSKTLITDLRNAFYLFFKFLKRCAIFIFCILLFCFLAVMGLRCCTRLSLVALRKGATLYCGVQASHCSSFSCCGILALGHVGSVVAAPRL